MAYINGYDDYFYYSGLQFRDRYTWVKVKGVRLADVTCKEDGCAYKPMTSCLDPLKAYKAHMRKQHPARWAYLKNPTLIIKEEDDADTVDIDALRELLYA